MNQDAALKAAALRLNLKPLVCSAEFLRFGRSAAVFSAALFGFSSAPWRGPRRNQGTCEEFCTHLGEGSEKRIIGRRAAQAFADWIHPDIPSDAVECVGGPQNTVVVFELPETTMCASGEVDARFLLEGFDEFDQVAFVGRADREEMDVIRHDTICMDEKRAKAGVFFEVGDEP